MNRGSIAMRGKRLPINPGRMKNSFVTGGSIDLSGCNYVSSRLPRGLSISPNAFLRHTRDKGILISGQ